MSEQNNSYVPGSVRVDDNAYKYVSEQAKLVGKKIEKELVGLSVKDAIGLLECVRRAISQKAKVCAD